MLAGLELHLTASCVPSGITPAESSCSASHHLDAVTAGGGPERLRIILEGESLLNDASSITLFTIFIEFVIEAAEGHPNTSSAGHIVGTIVRRMIWLAVGEATWPHACLSTPSAEQQQPLRTACCGIGGCAWVQLMPCLH